MWHFDLRRVEPFYGYFLLRVAQKNNIKWSLRSVETPLDKCRKLQEAQRALFSMVWTAAALKRGRPLKLYEWRLFCDTFSNIYCFQNPVWQIYKDVTPKYYGIGVTFKKKIPAGEKIKRRRYVGCAALFTWFDQSECILRSFRPIIFSFFQESTRSHISLVTPDQSKKPLSVQHVNGSSKIDPGWDPLFWLLREKKAIKVRRCWSLSSLSLSTDTVMTLVWRQWVLSVCVVYAGRSGSSSKSTTTPVPHSTEECHLKKWLLGAQPIDIIFRASDLLILAVHLPHTHWLKHPWHPCNMRGMCYVQPLCHKLFCLNRVKLHHGVTKQHCNTVPLKKQCTQ